MKQLAFALPLLLASLSSQASAATIDAGAWPPAEEAAAARRFAIVIGNGDYTSIPDLRNSRADARLMAEFLADQGYEVLDYTDLTKAGFEQMLRRILIEVDRDSEVVLFYAGHGVQIAGGNYLIPVDADLDNAYDVPFEAVSLTSVVEIVGARARRQLVILDSCRDNPFGATRVISSLSGGLVETRDGFNALTAPINSLLAFSTSPGAVAYDGTADNSFFTQALVTAARDAPDLPITDVFARVRRLVYQETDGRQVPWESSTLVEPVSFAGGPTTRAAATTRDAGASVDLFSAELEEHAPGGVIRLSAPLSEEVALGSALMAALEVRPEERARVARNAKHGRLVLHPTEGRRQAAAGVELRGTDLETLTYVSELLEIPGSTASGAPVTDSFALNAGGAEHEVALSLHPNPCDAAAGDHLDPDGVGLARYPNEIEPEAALAACRAAVVADPENARFHYQLGRAYLALRQFDEAQAAFETALERGHARANVALGNLIANESAITGAAANGPVPEEALEHWRKGAERGDPYAYHALGRYHLRHGESEAERRQGFELLSRAVELGHTFSMNELGFFFLDPEGPYADPARGLRYLEEAAGRGDIYGYNNLGIVYRDGLAGAEANPARAEEWFRKAAAGGHPYAPGNLGRLWNSGALGPDDQYGRAVEWYDEGLERGDGWAGANAAWIIAKRGVPGLTLRDAALRAAKAATLRGEDSAAEARVLLEDLPPQALDGAAQMLVNALGGAIEVDGAFGAGSQAEMARVLAEMGEEPPAGGPLERLLDLAAIYWRHSPFRVDLY